MSIFSQHIEQAVHQSYIEPGSVFWEEYIQYLPPELSMSYNVQTLELNLEDHDSYKSICVYDAEKFPSKILPGGLKYICLKHLNLIIKCDELDGDGTHWVAENFWFDGTYLKNIQVDTKKFNDTSTVRLFTKFIENLKLNTKWLILPFCNDAPNHPWGTHIPVALGKVVVNKDATVQIHMKYSNNSLLDIDKILRYPGCWDDGDGNVFHSQSNRQIKPGVNMMDIMHLPNWLRDMYAYEIYFDKPYRNIKNIRISKNIVTRSWNTPNASGLITPSDSSAFDNYRSSDGYYLYL